MSDQSSSSHVLSVGVGLGDELCLSKILAALASDRGPVGYFALYAPSDQDVSPASRYLVGRPMEVDDDLVEHLPSDVALRGYQFAFSDETLEGVLLYARAREPSCSLGRLVELLDYYSKHDTFPMR